MSTRIYADFNGLVDGIVNPSRTAVVLDTFGSVRDLANAGVVLREGLPLIAVDWSDESEDLEGHGTAQFDSINGWWVIEFDELGVRYVPAGNRESVEDFRCVRCGKPFLGMSPTLAFSPGTNCSSCGTNILAPIAPPAGVEK